MGRPPARFCVRGHDTDITGRRAADNYCKACSLEASRKHRRAFRHGNISRAKDCPTQCQPCRDVLERSFLRHAQWPVEPLRNLIPRIESQGGFYKSMGGIKARLSTNDARTLHRILKAGRISPYQADRFACLLGVHVSEIYPQWFEDAVSS